MSFVHLHTHSEYSLLDGANRIDDLIRRALEFEMPALALTDHGSMYGAWSFRQKAERAGLKPIIGMEAYVAPGDRRHRPAPGSGKSNKGERPYYHLVLLARDLEGYRNLVRLTSIGYLEGFYRRPRIDRETLARYSNGLIVTSACMAGELARHLAEGRRDEARQAAQWYAETFPDRYYLEVQAHDTPGQAQLNQEVLALAEQMGLPVVATNDAHFLQADDHAAHDVLLCIGLGKDLEDTGRIRYDQGLYFKSPDEMAQCFPDRPDVLENTLQVADSVNLELQQQYHVPKFPLPEGFSREAELLRHLALEGARERYGEPLSDQITQRLEYELEVINGTGYPGYFLITQDFIRWAKEEGIPVGPGRGSAAGSIVAYALRITDVDPLRFDLLFERFLNPERISMPDIDVDFCYERRSKVIEYVRQRYGKDSVGQIITFGTMKSRAVVRDVGRVLGFEPSETDRLAKLVPNAPGSAVTLSDAVNKVPELKELYAGDQRVHQLLDYAKVLEGLARHASVHAAGVVIAPGPLPEYVPVCTQPARGANANGEAAEGVVVTQWDMGALEQAGMLKMDFLGLKTLTVISDSVEWIRRRHGALRHPDTGVEYEKAEDLPLDDAAVFQMLARGGTAGVFQFESSLATDKLRAMRCDRFEDLIATNALIRPGPLDTGMTDVYIRRKLGREKVRYPHPLLSELLEPTYGVITYQEQVMRIAQVLAGFSLAEADVLRKAVGKKDAELIESELERFVSRAMANGIEKRTARDIAEQIATFGRYGFNRAHSVAYALLSYQTAWLKRHYPAEFMAALLSSVLDKTEDVVKYIGDCREMHRFVPSLPGKMEVLPPAVNESEWKFTPVDAHRIRFGLGAIRGLGESSVREILAARRDGEQFQSLFQLSTRVDLRVVGKRSLEALILSGACDSLAARLPSGAAHRAQLLQGLDQTVREAQLREAEHLAGQVSLFGEESSQEPQAEPPLPDVEPWTELQRLTFEKEALGFFITGHPLDRFRDLALIYDSVTTATLADRRGQRIELVCVVTGVKRQRSRRDGAEWARLSVEDFAGTATVLAFGDAWREAVPTLEQEDAAVLISGTVSDKERDEDDPPIFLDKATPLGAVRESGDLGVELEILPENGVGEQAIAEGTRLFREFPGPAPVYVRCSGHAERFCSRAFQVKPTEALLEKLRGVFGKEQVRLIRAVGANGR